MGKCTDGFFSCTFALRCELYSAQLASWQGRSDGGVYWYLYPQKSTQVNFL